MSSGRKSREQVRLLKARVILSNLGPRGSKRCPSKAFNRMLK